MPAAGIPHRGNRPHGEGNGLLFGCLKKWMRGISAVRQAGKASAAVLAAVAASILAAAAPPDRVWAASLTNDDIFYMESQSVADFRGGLPPGAGPAVLKPKTAGSGAPGPDRGLPPPGDEPLPSIVEAAAGGIRDGHTADPEGRGDRPGELVPLSGKGTGPDKPHFADISRLVRSGTSEARAASPGSSGRTIMAVRDGAPKPAALILLGSALVVLAWLGRRRRS
jgi:hypothetical protein